MKTFFTGCFLFILSLQSIGQDKLYFDQNFKNSSPSKTPYFRLVSFNQENVSVKDYKKDKLCLQATIKGVNDIDSVNGFLWYIRNGLAKFNYQTYFQNLKGEFTFYQDNGTTTSAEFNGKKLLYSSLLDSLNNQYLIMGTGNYIQESKIQGEWEHLIFKDSILVEYLYIRPEKQDTVYNIYDQMAEPPGGLQNYYAKLISTLKYPFLKQIAGEEKTIHIRFVVDEYGSLTEFEALTQKVTRFEAKTIKKLSKLPPWKPAMKDGKPVKTRFLLPVIFELK